MKILFDGQIFELQKYGGISRYFSELFKYFESSKEIEYELPLGNNQNEHLLGTALFSSPNLGRRDALPPIIIKVRRRLSRLLSLFDRDSYQNRARRALKTQNFDVFHPTYYSTYFLKYLKGKPLVLTVHDMIHELYPRYFLRDCGRTARRKKRLILRADKIIAVSENTKKDIISFYGIPESKIKVIYLGNSLRPVEGECPGLPAIPERYILFVGSRRGYKNFKAFIQAIAPLLKKDKSLYVVCAGGYSGQANFSFGERRWLKKLEIIGQVRLYSVNDEVLAYLYQHAICLALPALYEGFGIPVLETFACGCPAVISRSSSLPEIAGEAAQYFDPTDEQDMLEVFERVIGDDTLRREMVQKGLAQLAKFSWEKTARATQEVYNSL